VKGDAIAFGEYHGRNTAAFLRDGRLYDLLIDPPEGVLRPGAVLRAVADRPMKGMGGQFVKLPNCNGFLRGSGLAAGSSVLVQVSGYAEPGKAVPVTTKLQFRGRYVIATPNAPGVNISRKIKDPVRRKALSQLFFNIPSLTGAILRSECSNADDDAIVEEATRLDRLVNDVYSGNHTAPKLLLDGPSPQDCALCDWSDSPSGTLDDFAVYDLIDKMQEPLVEIGATTMFVEPTRAFVAIDVNTGNDTSPATGLKANIAVAKDLPRQLRCRGLGGQIVIDFAPFPKKDRGLVETALRSSFRNDPVETALVGWTPLGHFELRRKNARYPLT